MARNATRQIRLESAHAREMEEAKVSDDTSVLSQSGQELIDWLAEGDAPTTEPEVGTYESIAPTKDIDLEDTDPDMNIYRLDLDPDGAVPRTTEDELARVNGFSFTFVPDGRHGSSDKKSISEPGTVGFLKRTSYEETSIANLDWDF